MPRSTRRSLLLSALVVEGGLGVLAVLLGWATGRPTLSAIEWNLTGLGYGLVATAVPLTAFAVVVHVELPGFGQIHRFGEDVLRPLFADARLVDLLLISVAAGLGEELLFRVFLQRLFVEWVGVAAGIVLAGVAFGLAHPLGRTYVLYVTVMGWYLGWLQHDHRNPLVPIVCHAAYDFLALAYWLRILGEPRDSGTMRSSDACPREATESDERNRTMRTMQAAYLERTGSPEVIQYGPLPVPSVGGSQALVKVEAVALNPVDTYIRAGAIPMDLPLPFVVGCDLAGIVEEVGPNVSGLKAGDRVWGSNQGLLGRQGTFAEYAAVDEQWLYPIPDGVDAETIVAISLVGITAHLGLVRDAKLEAGETLAVVGGSGGVGSMVVQMGKALGATVLTTAGSGPKEELCRQFGADAVVRYDEHDLFDGLSTAAPGGVDVFWETRRTPDFERTVPLLAPRGRFVLMAGRDARPPFPVGPFYVKGCSLHGFAMFNATPAEQRRAADDINGWVAEGKLKANIDRRMKLSEAADAHALQEASTVSQENTLHGKIVLTP